MQMGSGTLNVHWGVSRQRSGAVVIWRVDVKGLYPTAVLNPDNYGGERLFATVFLRYMPTEQPWYIDLQYMHPLMQDLNTPQMGIDHTVELTVG